MGARRTDMHRLQEMLRLHRLGQGSRGIARQLHIGRDTIRAYMRALATAGLLEGAPNELPDLDQLRAAVEEHVQSRQAPQQRSSVERWVATIERLRKKGAGPSAIHDWLRLNEPDFDGSLSAIKRLVLRLADAEGPKPTDVAISVETTAGEVAQVDFGYVGKRYDPERGVLRKSWLFVMTLGCSRHMHTQIVFDQKIETWVRLHVEAFEYFGGVPRVIVPDNLKAAVIRASFGVDGEPVLNRTYVELARYYGFQIDPTPPRAPEKKGKVERGVRYTKGNFFATHESVDIHEDRRALRRWTLEIAGRRRHGTTGRAPLEYFEEEERAALLSLPQSRWELVIWKKARLHRDSHVQVDGAFYSAPWTLLGQDLWLRCTTHSIVIYAEDCRLHAHSRVPRGKRSTIESHLPEHRRDLRHRSREHWIVRARVIGEEVEVLAAAIFDSDDVLYQLRKVQAVVTHLEGFPRERARATARRALHFGCLEYRSIKSILKQGLDLEPLPEESGRAWSQGSMFARNPSETLTAIQEKTHGDRR
ncbi:IS21 family transposase [Engelhardtia mirabilis]|uniref:Integrase core domain protein n=2 Tax=Engelhardtia mirabilis TaxID=2528011 RepID=A0A518BH01_9BACT|nr:Integrase core domain protein [Planctomycetes bacterium Pla133]QDU99424.1 Integrase core domain protein [Planctomycetes bacterium Pla86]QDU66499.1 Integrase core domain protein [Planctomycetes bacterium Pla133]QDU70117.1 Integrase core domain protein [Planctomycetes bacterium Pla133]QDV00563.1 Integrase core domain protein [Planctomycetes bacterium Pla86]